MLGMKTFHKIVMYQVKLVFNTLQDLITLYITVYFIIDKYKNGEFYLVIASNGQGWDHVSVSMHRKNDKGKIIKYLINGGRE